MESEKLTEAIKSIESGKSLSATAKAYCIDKGTLCHIVKGYRLAQQNMNKQSKQRCNWRCISISELWQWRRDILIVVVSGSLIGIILGFIIVSQRVGQG